ncbi:MAG: 3-methyl-2-oxobutanoate hydroxymethyltransferase [Chloroflexi bacterium]|uniref:3-methyl-2-oxobutanoate hydroxymethyltransferase n=2 Tax=Candidatus Chlorohelix allophototropha TaxID=3003348 RepID=A0A8T7LRU1_9CHLR|nr:3-methyl-2-oxobutanoate hydroxymethyltransferase [Chloroflexota bacterium]
MAKTLTQSKKKTIPEIMGRKATAGAPKIAMVTAYDYPSALIADRVGMDMILVGDSLAMVVLGYDSTVSVTMEEMLHHCKAVRRGAKDSILVGDMPFGSYQTGSEEAIRNAVRFLKEAGMDAVKLEGGVYQAEIARAIVRSGIPVMGHIGLLPQLVSATGGFKVQGRDEEGARRLLEDAKAMEEAGCFAIVLEAIPDRLATMITNSIKIPTIGIGAGAGCDGQVLVMHDLIGLFDRFTPRFVKKYANVYGMIEDALTQYRDEVVNGQFPATEHTFTIKDDVLARLYA